MDPTELNKKYDVFLSYNSQDREVIERIAVLIGNRTGMKPWFDKWDLIPGEPWVRELERGIRASKSCAVFVGAGGEGPWQKKEVGALLDQQVQHGDFRVIPVLLPGCTKHPDLPIFLAGNTWVEFKNDDDEDALWRLECGIKGKPPGKGRPKDNDTQSDHKPMPFLDIKNLIVPGGAVDVDSRFYIKRKADYEVFTEIQKKRGLVTVKGPRQTGKTSLIMHVYFNVKQGNDSLKTAFIDFQSFSQDDFKNLNCVWKAIARQVEYQLELDYFASNEWDFDSSHDRNLSNFMRFVFSQDKTPLLICMDETDRLFKTPVKADFFSTLRSYYNLGAIDPYWKNVRWIISTSSEPAFFIKDLSQSPFNIGLTTVLHSFTRDEIKELALRLGLNLCDDFTEKIFSYIGGRPYLVHLLLYNILKNPGHESEKALFNAKTAGSGIFLEYLNRYLKIFQKDPELSNTMKNIIDGHECKDIILINRLESAGLILRDNDKISVACKLYLEFFKNKFGLNLNK